MNSVWQVLIGGLSGASVGCVVLGNAGSGVALGVAAIPLALIHLADTIRETP